jgi:hypothetical protein
MLMVREVIPQVETSFAASTDRKLASLTALNLKDIPILFLTVMVHCQLWYS